MVIRRGWKRLGVVVLATVLLGGCRELDGAGQDGPTPDQRQPEMVIFLFDRSTSVNRHELEHAQKLTRERIGRLEHGDRIVAIELLEHSLAEEARRWSQQVPERRYPDLRVRRDSVDAARFVRDARDYIARFSDPEDRDHISGTDILSTLHLVAAELQAYPDHRSTLVLYSDMLQANQEMNMEGLARMPPADWIRSRAPRGLLPGLEGLCVVVVGARNDTGASRIVMDFWKEYFQTTGAVLEEVNWAYRPVQIPGRPCPGM
jgi:hypothetical protein